MFNRNKTMRVVRIIMCILVMSPIQWANCQTKKIANASHNSSGPMFDWSSSDNLGAIMEYEKIRTYHIQYDSVVSSTPADTSIVTDSLVQDSLTTIYEEALKGDTNVKIDKVKIREMKILGNPPAIDSSTGDANKTIDGAGLKQEIIRVEKHKPIDRPKASSKSMFFLLLVPIGYLMVKKN
jgi:hypothetical protein